MKLIHNFKSPNFNKRKHNKIELIIIHYTALENINESLRYLCDVKNKVSCHYLISQKGQIYNLVSEKNDEIIVQLFRNSRSDFAEC